MSHGYVAVGFNPQKRRYDTVLWTCVTLSIALFSAVTVWLQPSTTVETVLIRAFGLTAIVLLHVILSIGPLCRLDRRFLPLLYNRRHMGVTMFGVALAHGVLAFVTFHTQGTLTPLDSLFLGDVGWRGFGGVPFQPLGAMALAILFLLAATSHDFWLAHLTPRVWKSLHMLVYAAYALLVLHVALGWLQSDTGAVATTAVALGMLWLLTLHGLAARDSARRDRAGEVVDGFVDAGPVAAIPEAGAVGVNVAGERVAVFRHAGKLHAVSGVCRHQNGPLAEGRIVDGCITCPWHGYQYRPDDGCAPAPFTETLTTFPLRVVEGRVRVATRPLPAGTPCEPANGGAPTAAPIDEFYVGWAQRAAPAQARFTARTARRIAAIALLAIAGLAATQAPLPDARFEFGVARQFSGEIALMPYPVLRVARPAGAVAAYLLVGEGKHGAEATVGAFAGQTVSLHGSLIHHGEHTMIQVQPGSVRPAAPRQRLADTIVNDLGPLTLRGEIVDSKCHLGVMNPGQRRTHRACAKLCIRGGVPPILLVEDGRGGMAKLLLTDRRGAPLRDEILALVGDPIEVDGRVQSFDNLLVMRVEPTSMRRL